MQRYSIEFDISAFLGDPVRLVVSSDTMLLLDALEQGSAWKKLREELSVKYGNLAPIRSKIGWPIGLGYAKELLTFITERLPIEYSEVKVILANKYTASVTK